jgi:anti-sigma factor RsiW
MSSVLRRTRFRRDHRWTPGHMSDYLDGELASRPRRRLERHVRECEECRRILRSLQGMIGRLRGIAPPATRPDPREMAARVRERLGQYQEG